MRRTLLEGQGSHTVRLRDGAVDAVRALPTVNFFEGGALVATPFRWQESSTLPIGSFIGGLKGGMIGCCFDLPEFALPIRVEILFN